MNNKKIGFTLAELLITLGIIGVVAVLALPTLMTNIGERMNSEKEANTALRVTHAIELMKANNELDQKYASTDAFVDRLQNYLAITQRCKASNIAQCWTTDTVIDMDGNEYEVYKAKAGKDLNLKGNTTDNVGLVLNNGVHLIMSYNQDAEPMQQGYPTSQKNKALSVGFGKTKDFAYTTSTVGRFVDFVMDVNGKNGPNKESAKADVRSFNVARFTKGCAGIETSVGCVVQLGSITPENTCDGTNNWDKNFTSANGYGSYCANNYWAGAKAGCAKAGMTLPDKSKLAAIRKTKTAGLPTSDYFWSSSEYTVNFASTVNFSSGSTSSYSKSYSYHGALCLGD